MVSKTKSNAKNEKEVVKDTPSKSGNDTKEESVSTSHESSNNNTESTLTNSIENVDISTLTVDSSKVINSEAQGGTFGDNVQRITVQGFKGNIHSAFISGFGQSSGFETTFFIMTDGTVEYVPIQKLYDTCGYLNDATINSYGVIANVSGVAKIITANGNAPYSTGAATTLGIKADGTFYDFQFNLDVNSLAY